MPRLDDDLESHELLADEDFFDDQAGRYLKPRPGRRPQSWPGAVPFWQLCQIRRRLLGRWGRLVWGHPIIIKLAQLRRILRQFLLYSFVVLVVISLIRALLYPSYSNPPAHYKSLSNRISNSKQPGRGNPNNEKIFIAGNIVKEDLIRGHWGASVLELIDILGPENTFLSVYENDSGPSTAAALRELRDKVTCKKISSKAGIDNPGNSSIIAGQHLPLDGFPTVTIPSGDQRVKRIEYLAGARNNLLKPLDTNEKDASLLPEGFQYARTKFDKILFLNDIYFSAIEATQLLFATNADEDGRANYRVACAVDFIGWAMIYDTFVTRDNEGYGMGLMFYPWFTPSGRAESRNDVLSEKDAVRVKSCWNGMASYDARFFQTPVSIPWSGIEDSPHVENPPSLLRFRFEPELFWEAAECCLINADIHHLFPPVDPDDRGIYLNPYVRVAYKPVTYSWIPSMKRIERGFSIFQNLISRGFYPEFNPRRLHEGGTVQTQKVWQYEDVAQNKMSFPLQGSFKELSRQVRPGGFCGQQRLFVMRNITNNTNKDGAKNWEKILVPQR